MIFYKDKVSLWAQATKHGELTYTFTTVQRPWYHFEAFDGNEFFTGGRIETVDENRIRIYFHKHHNILDLADEYYRTDDFESFKQIMEQTPLLKNFLYMIWYYFVFGILTVILFSIYEYYT